jgi:hypothetical protein
MLNQMANTITAARGRNQRAILVTRAEEEICSITFIIWAYTIISKKGSLMEYD